MPKIITAREIGLSFQNVFGELGPEFYVTGHHTGGPKDLSDGHAVDLCVRYHGDHMRKGWGGIGYFYCVTRNGTIICLRPTRLKGAHVGGHNSNNIGVMFHGTVGDVPTRAQARAYRWLLSNAHKKVMPAAHRTDRPLRRPYCKRYGHNDWSGHSSNACPGTHKTMILSSGLRGYRR